MILYFANRKMEILGSAATNLPNGIKILEDVKTEETETGVATFSCKIPFTKKTRKKAEEYTEVGNYLLRSNGDENEFYTIIDAEIDTETRDIYVYAEDAGLELLNDIALKVSYDSAHNQTWYVSETIKDTGFEIGIDESDDAEKQLSFDEETITKRLNSITEEFSYELSFSFSVENLSITHKYVNIYKKRGKDTGIQLRLNRDINKIITKKSVADLATALLVTGATPDGTDIPVTLDGYQYDDGDFYVDGHYLKSRNAFDRWGRVVWKNDSGKMTESERHIVKTFTYDTVNQEELCKQSIAELKKVCDISANYEVDIAKLPDDVKIGDTVNIVDDEGELYLSARVLKLEKSVADKSNVATLGDYLIKENGISQKVEELAAQFSEIAKNRTLYTWIAYADDKYGSGITLDPDNKPYIGITTNKLKKEVDISDPSIFAWSKIEGGQGEPGRSQEKVEDQYYLSTSNTEAIGGEWSFKMPEWESGKYIWKRYAVTWSDGAVTYTSPVLDSAINHANEASDYAIQQAGVAKDSADNAKNAAISAENNAKTASDASIKAQNTANEANAIASTAQSVANAAQKAADEANADVAVISKEVSNIREDVAIVRDDLQDKVTTVKETMEAFYAKKTDVSDTEATIRAEISKSVAEIQTTMESDYAKKTELTEVQSNLQTQVTQNATNITSTASAVEEVRIDASNAQNKAAEATVTAGNAQSAADEAIQKANDAQVSATQSVQAAQAAQEKANDAQTSADTAQKAAENANVIAQAAQKDLDTAKENLETVKNRVGATEEDIAAAQAAVDTAQKAADSAKADATNASSAAAAAQKVADKAKSDAATAQSAADIAQKNAQNAKTAADNAQKSADEANAAIGNLANTVTTMSTKVDQNAEAITLAATKKEVENKLSGYSTTSEMNSAINQSASSVLTTVEGIYTTKTDTEEQINAVKASLELKVDKDTLISEINASADVITLTGNRFIVNSDNFKLTADGTMTANNGIFGGTLNGATGSFSGNISASSGMIGANGEGFYISNSGLYATYSSNIREKSTRYFSFSKPSTNNFDFVFTYDNIDNDIVDKNNGIKESHINYFRVNIEYSYSRTVTNSESKNDSNGDETVTDTDTTETVTDSMTVDIDTSKLVLLSTNVSESENILTYTLSYCVNFESGYSSLDAYIQSLLSSYSSDYVLQDYSFSSSAYVVFNNINTYACISTKQLKYGQVFEIDEDKVTAKNLKIKDSTIAVINNGYQSELSNNYLTLQSLTVNSNSYNSVGVNPSILFKNNNGSQNLALIYTDYDSVKAPASLTLVGNQGGEYFIAPNVQVRNKLYVGNGGSNIYYGQYNKTKNLYYATQGYHAFYINGKGVAYIQYNGINMNKNIMFRDNQGITAYDHSNWYMLRCYDAANHTNTVALGNSHLSTSVYTTSSVWYNGSSSTKLSTTSSDKRLKEDFVDIEKYEDMFMDLKPVTYKFHDGLYNVKGTKPLRTWGFVANEVIDAFEKNGLDWKDEELVTIDRDGEYTDEELKYVDNHTMLKMNYQNMISLNTHMIQKTRKEMLYQTGCIDLHETIIQDLQNRIYHLEKQIKELRQAVV
ncbi:hypothetical protein BHF70_00825 [Anaerostipes sp. 494a]|uniref:phage tail spike protein n=1 Tax=Anaerostipes sp. 494a TaxID=1261636 RepID=UPI000953318A|nr:phage tail spike protein [Anaerostipes sp. 494a]OLR58293.1 hypothetical protein BHF70_00825 [Anaerostipes sp. 494a]